MNNGITMPCIGFGTFMITEAEVCKKAIHEALEVGYRMIDTAQGYGNEAFIGEALSTCGIPREELFITTKVWFRNYDDAYNSVIQSLRNLHTDYLDLVLLHWPFGNTYAAWRSLEKLYGEGKIRAIGVSNYNPDRLVDLIQYNKVVPAVNQIETNLYSQQAECRKWLDKYGVCHQGYAPLGQGRANGMFEESVLQAMAHKYGKTPQQIVLRFQTQEGVIVIPKSVHKERMVENISIFDFELTADEVSALRALDKAQPLIGNPHNPVLVESSMNW